MKSAATGNLKRKISVVIPARNEREGIEKTIRAIPKDELERMEGEAQNLERRLRKFPLISHILDKLPGCFIFFYREASHTEPYLQIRGRFGRPKSQNP